MKNTHINHLEDLVFLNEGRDLFKIYESFKRLYISIQNKHIVNDIKLSLKIDGSPSVTCFNSFYQYNIPGVSTKSMLNKTPLIYFSDKEIDDKFNDKPDLAHKLKTLLKAIPNLNIPDNEIWQGDFLFDVKSIKKSVINGDEY